MIHTIVKMALYNIIIALSIALVFLLIWDEYRREKIKEKYSIVFWDEHEGMYVVKDRETKQQYIY